MDWDVPELILIYNFEKHGSFVLVKPFCSLVDMVIRSGVRAPNDLSRVSLKIAAVIKSLAITMTVTSLLYTQ